MAKVKLDLQALTDEEFAELLELVVTRMTGNAAFPTPNPALTVLTANVDDLRTLIGQRKSLLAQAQQKTIAIRAKRDVGSTTITNEANYVEGIANASTDPANPPDAIIASAGMEVAGTASPVGPMPQITALAATQSDSDGEVDLHWNPIKRGLNSYLIEKTTDPAGQTGWSYAATATKSSAAVTGLTSGTRYWFRVAGVGAAGQGPWSDPATKVAP